MKFQVMMYFKLTWQQVLILDFKRCVCFLSNCIKLLRENFEGLGPISERFSSIDPYVRFWNFLFILMKLIEHDLQFFDCHYENFVGVFPALPLH